MAADRDERMRSWMVSIAKALFMNRLHVLRLTEVVRNNIKPNEDGAMVLPADLDEEMKKQAFDYILMTMPEEFRVDILQHRSLWLTVQ
jgi:hypothetical protein